MASCASSQVETWRMMEIPFSSETDYSATGADVRLEWFNPRTWETLPAVEVRETGSEHVKVLYDVYHQQVSEGNLISAIRANAQWIGHVHIAGVPERNEPLEGEVNYTAVISALKAASYHGAVGIEYFPTKDAVEGIRETMEAISL